MTQKQAAAARALLLQASVVAVPVPVFCELAWVLKRSYARSGAEIAAAIEAFTALEVIATDLPAVEAGLVALRAGGDFADGVIAHQGEALGGTVFASLRSPRRRPPARQRRSCRRPVGTDRLNRRAVLVKQVGGGADLPHEGLLPGAGAMGSIGPRIGHILS